MKYYVSSWTQSLYAIGELGAYLDDGSVHANYYKPVYGVNPQVKSPGGVFYADTVNWLPVYGNFVADGMEEYLTLGNFKSEIATNYILYNSNSTRWVAAYYIEDVSVIESDLPAYAGHDTTLLQGDSTFIGRTPEIGLECVWYANGTQLQTQEAGFWASPDTTTTYIVKQDLCDNIKYDTVIVTVIPNGIKEKEKGDLSFEIYPNPNNGKFMLRHTAYNVQGTDITVQNIPGETVYTSKSASNNLELDLSGLANGTYFVTVRDIHNKQVTKRLIINK